MIVRTACTSKRLKFLVTKADQTTVKPLVAATIALLITAGCSDGFDEGEPYQTIETVVTFPECVEVGEIELADDFWVSSDDVPELWRSTEVALELRLQGDQARLVESSGTGTSISLTKSDRAPQEPECSVG